MPETAVRIAQMFDRFQKAAATKGILEQQLASEEAELVKLDLDLQTGLAAVGYQAVQGGPTPEEFLLASMTAIETELNNFERAVQ